MMPCEKTWTRCFAFFSSHVCIHRPSFSYFIFVLHACSVSSASKILLLFTWRSHNVFGRVIAVTIFFPLLSSVVILSEHWFQAGILSCRSFFFFLMGIIVHYALFGVWCKNSHMFCLLMWAFLHFESAHCYLVAATKEVVTHYRGTNGHTL